MSNISEKKTKEFLDLTDKRLLYELDLKSDSSYQDISKKIGIPKETVAFRIKRLTKKGIIKNFITTIHASRFDYYYYKFFFKFQKTTEQKELDITEYLKHNKSIAYLATLEGRYDLTCLVIAKNIDDLQLFLNHFKLKFGEYILEQEILTLTQVNRFNFRFFYEPGKSCCDTYPENLQENNIDDIDYAIIKKLAKNSRENLSALARQLKTHTNVVRYRIEKLKKLGVIGSPVLDIDFTKCNVEHYQINFSLKNQLSIGPTMEYIPTLPESTFATVTLGKYDLAIEFAVHTAERIKEIVNSIRNKFPEDIVSYDIFTLHEHTVNWFPEKSPR